MSNFLQRMATWCPSGTCVAARCGPGAAHCFVPTPAGGAAADTSPDAFPSLWVAALAATVAGAAASRIDRGARTRQSRRLAPVPTVARRISALRLAASADPATPAGKQLASLSADVVPEESHSAEAREAFGHVAAWSRLHKREAETARRMGPETACQGTALLAGAAGKGEVCAALGTAREIVDLAAARRRLS